MNIENVVDINVEYKGFNPIELAYYAKSKIPNYRTITEIPKEHMDYLNSVIYVVNCDSMFSKCTALTTLDLSKFNSNNVNNTMNMFYGCKSLTSLKLDNFNTSKVTDISYMFELCTNLTTIDVSGFNTSQVTNMTSVFEGCELITELDVSNWDTSKVTNMSGIFSQCRSLTSLDLSNWNTSKVTNMNYMFDSCTSLTTIKGTLDLSSCKNVSDMFLDNIFKGLHLKNVPRSLLDTDGSLKGAVGTLNETYIIDNILEDK